MSLDYHSARADHAATTAYPPLDRFESPDGSGQALVHDLAAHQALPPEYAAAQPGLVLYAEPPFPAGYKVFAERAHLAPTPANPSGQAVPYPAFIRLLTQLVASNPLGGVCILSRPALKYVATPPDASIEITLHRPGNLATACYWRYPLRTPLPSTALEIITTIAADPATTTLGDPCCGYGLTGRVAAANDPPRRWVLSDLVPECIGHIAATSPSWAASVIAPNTAR
jgi:hypothetical protein